MDQNAYISWYLDFILLQYYAEYFFPGRFELFDFSVLTMDMSRVPEIFDNLSYGPAPESDAAARAWIKEHNGKFGHFINNEWVHPEDREKSPSINPGTLEVLAHTIEGTESDVNDAVAAAKSAYRGWSGLKAHERARYIYAIARHLQKHHRLLAVLESMDNGKSHREARDGDCNLLFRHMYYHAGWAQLLEEEMPNYKSLGVVGCIPPFDFPMLLFAWKIAPSLAAGNTVVVKPSSATRLSSLLFAQICVEAGLPKGVLNVVLGTGPIVGQSIVDHVDIDKIAFTGSGLVGKEIRRRLAGTGKSLSMELGGGAPLIVFDTSDIDSAIEGCVDATFANTGAIGCAGSRLLVQENIAKRFIKKLYERVDHMRLGHPLDKSIDMGAVVHEDQYNKINQFIEEAREEGATVYQARIEIPKTGYYIPPTIITNVGNDSRIIREEIFGPVLPILTFRNPNEAIALANNTMFGLAASVWTENVSLALEVSLSIKAGVVWVNSHNRFDAAAGFGGYKESGFGREGGKEGLFEVTRPKWMKRPQLDLKFPIDGPKWPNPAPGRPALLPTKLTESNGVDKTAKMYFGGKQARPDGHYYYQVINPDGGVVGQAGEGNRKDIRDAVEAARKAAPGWGKRAAYNRAQICFYLAENLDYRRAEFAQRIIAMTGRSEKSALDEVEETISRLFYYAAYADKYGGQVQETTLYGVTTSINEPVGVIGIVCPDEYPLLGFVSLFAPAVVRANTVVVIPSHKYPLSATDLYQIFETSDLPAGVVNIITGDGDLLSKTLSEHQNVDAMWYFGSAQGSANIEYASALNMKRSWVNYGVERDWMSREQGQGIEFLHESCEVKNIWIPMVRRLYL